MNEYEEFIKIVIAKAGDAALRHFGKNISQHAKSDRNDIVTKADFASEKIIKDAIRKKFPAHGIVSEESGDNTPDKEYVWYIDPLDGTRNFAFGMPTFGITITLVHKNIPQMAASYIPYMKELFIAIKNKGVFLNGKRVKCSEHKDFIDSVGNISTRWTRKKIDKLSKNILARLSDDKVMIYATSCSAYSSTCIAAGRLDWIIGQGAKIWDYLPAYLIMKEAGCTVTDLMGDPWNMKSHGIVAANPQLHKQIIRLTSKL